MLGLGLWWCVGWACGLGGFVGVVVVGVVTVWCEGGGEGWCLVGLGRCCYGCVGVLFVGVKAVLTNNL